MSKIEEINSYIGPLILRRVKLERELLDMKDRYQGATQPEEIGQLHQQITEHATALDQTKDQVRQLRSQQVYILKADLIQLELRKGTPASVQRRQDLYDQEQDLNTVINQLENLINHG